MSAAAAKRSCSQFQPARSPTTSSAPPTASAAMCRAPAIAWSRRLGSVPTPGSAGSILATTHSRSWPGICVAIELITPRTSCPARPVPS